MSKMTNKFINTFCHIVIDGQASQKFYLTTHVILVLQTITSIADPQSTLFQIVRWSDPSTFLNPSFIIIFSSIIVVLLTLFVISKLIMTESDEMLKKPTIFKIYFANILLHLGMICKTSVLSPFLRATSLSIQNPQSYGVKLIGIITLSIIVVLLLPLSFLNTSNTFILTPQINKKLTYINTYLFLYIFRIPLAILAPINQPGVVAISIIFFLLFISMSIKQPVLAYGNERLLKGMISCVAFACFTRLCQFVQGNSQQYILLQLVGMISFVALIDWIAQFRIKKIVQVPQPSIEQLKLLIFLVINIKQYFPILQYFIIGHHKRCENIECKCSSVISSLSNKEMENRYNDIPWYNFLIDFIQRHYCLRQMQELPESELKSRIKKYESIVVDLAEIYLFKLGNINRAYYIVSNYKNLLDSREENLFSFYQKRKIINYYLQENISARYYTPSKINLNADKFINFQNIFEKYRKLLLKTAKSNAIFWEQMGKRDPDDEKLKTLTFGLQKLHQKIIKTYKWITSSFQKSKNILQPITEDYYLNILNILPKSQFHVIENPKFQSIIHIQQEQLDKISEDMQAFSYKSQTPMCFITVDQKSFGRIIGSNSYFNKEMNLELERSAKLDDFMVPEMRKSHQIKMRQFINGDLFSLQHKHGFILSKKNKIIHAKILIQIMPSISDGLHYVFFMKKQQRYKKIVGLKNNESLAYTSESFDEAFEGRRIKEMILKVIKQQQLSTLKESKEIQIHFQQKQMNLRYIHQFTDNDINWLFIEIHDREECDIQTKYRISEKINELSHRQSETFQQKARKDSVISRTSSGYQKSNLQKSDLQQKIAAEKMKKLDERIKATYQILFFDDRKKIIKKLIIFISVLCILFMGTLISAIIVKIGNQSVYQNAKNSNKSFNSFLMTLTRAAYAVKNVNFNVFTNNSSQANYFYAMANKNINISQAMDNLVVNFNINDITQTWNTITCNPTNGQFFSNTENNFLSVSDFIQNPISNLLSTNSSIFNFAPNLNGLKIPLTSNQCTYFTFLINALYISIPNFLNLKRSIMDKILQKNVSVSIPLLLMFASIFIQGFIYLMRIVLIDLRITRLKEQSYDIIESLEREVFIEKLKKCKQFILKYTSNGSSFYDQKDMELSINEDKLNITSNKFDRTIDDKTERQLDIRPQTNDSKVCDIQNKGKQSKMPTNKIKKTFKKTTSLQICCKYCVLLFPSWIFALTSGALEVRQAVIIKNLIQIQSKIQILQQDSYLIAIYAKQYGTQGLQFQQYLNIQSYIPFLYNQILQIQRLLVTNQNDLTFLPSVKQFIDEASYSNVCTLKDFAFSPSLAKDCQVIEEGILTKGIYSTIIAYLSKINSLNSLYPNISALTNSQRLSYLNNTVFTSGYKILEYSDEIFTNALTLFEADFNGFITNATNIFIFTVIGINIVAIGIIIVQVRYFQAQIRSIIQIKSIFLLISFENIMRNEKLKLRFQQKIQQFKQLK